MPRDVGSFDERSEQRPSRRDSTASAADQRHCCPSSTSTLLQHASVKSHELGYGDGLVPDDLELPRPDLRPLRNDKELRPSEPDTSTVEDIEKWLRMTGEPNATLNMNIVQSSRASVERYLSEQLSEALLSEKDPLSADLDALDKKLNLSYDTIFNEINSEKLLSLPEKDNVFILPELHLDQLDQLEYCPDDLILGTEILPPVTAEPSCADSRVNNKDLIIDLEESIGGLNCKSRKAEEPVQIKTEDVESAQYEQFKDNINDIDSLVNDNFYNVSVVRNVEQLSKNNVSCKDSDVSTVKCSKKAEDKGESMHNNVMAGKSNILHRNVQGKSKAPRLESHVSSKRRFQPSIIKRKRKLMSSEENYCGNKDSTMPALWSPANKQSSITKMLMGNGSKGHVDDEWMKKESLTLTTKRGRRKKSLSTELSDRDEEKPQMIKPFSYYNQQELAISKALEDVGIRDNVLQHIMTGDNVKVWQCHQHDCGRQFAKLCSLKAHLLTHFGIKPFKCDYDGCSWAFYSEFKLKRHKETHLKKKDYMCSTPGCKRRFTTVYNLASHEKLHTRPNRIMCQVPECMAKFQTKRALETHMKSHDESLAPYVCNYEGCGKRYYGSNALMSHQRCHSYSHLDVTCVWPGCGKTFDQPCRLKTHMRSHTGHKPYACTFKGCKWAFSTSSKLKRHQKKHTNDRKFVCDVGDCHKAFMRSEHLKEHRLTHIEERFFQCHICTSAFSAKSSLYVHIKKHANKEFVNMARQQKKKKTVEKKTGGNKKKEVVYCSRVQPVRLTANKPRKTPANGQDRDPVDLETADVTAEHLLEETENMKRANCTPGEPGYGSKATPRAAVFFCPINFCSKCYNVKSGLRNHLQKEHVAPLSEIQNSSFKRLPELPGDSCSLGRGNKRTVDQQHQQHEQQQQQQQSTTTTTTTTATIPNDECPSTCSALWDVELPGWEGSARTGLTLADVFHLKSSRRAPATAAVTADATADATATATAAESDLKPADFEDELLLTDDLVSVYCQEDIDVPGYQILLLGNDDAHVNLRDLD